VATFHEESTPTGGDFKDQIVNYKTCIHVDPKLPSITLRSQFRAEGFFTSLQCEKFACRSFGLLRPVCEAVRLGKLAQSVHEAVGLDSAQSVQSR